MKYEKPQLIKFDDEIEYATGSFCSTGVGVSPAGNDCTTGVNAKGAGASCIAGGVPSKNRCSIGASP